MNQIKGENEVISPFSIEFIRMIVAEECKNYSMYFKSKKRDERTLRLLEKEICKKMTHITFINDLEEQCR